jgi:hypothetical protein
VNALVEKRARWIAFAVVAIYFVVQLSFLETFGLTDDDDYYIPAGISYFGWVKRAFTFEEGAWSRESIDKAFDINHEHPPVAKYVYGLSHDVFGGLFGPSDGARAGTVLFSTLCAALMMALALRHLGRRRGLFAGTVGVLFLLLLPRFFFHSHAATLDVPVAAMYLAAASVALFAERSRNAAILAGPVFGLASATKLNSPFVIIGYVVFILLTRRKREVFSVPLALLSMIFVGPLVFLLSWPWLWGDVVARVQQYVAFHLNHYGIYFLYFGTVYSKDPNAPWHAPFTMAASTTPLAVSLLAITGIVLGITLIRARLRFTEGPDDDQRREGDLLITLAVHALIGIAIVAFSGGPKYGGEKLFTPFFPFWCLLAGYGALRLYERASSRALAAGAISAAAISSFALQVRFGEYALSQYNALFGGLRGATAVGFERQYYDVAFRDLVEWLNTNAPQNARVHFLPNNWEYVRTYAWYKRGKDLREDIQVVNNEAQADLLVMSHERRFQRYGDDLRRWRARPVLLEKIVDGTPIWSVLKAR